MKEQKLLEIIKSILNRQQSCACHMAPEDWKPVMVLAGRHKLSHLLGFALELFPKEELPDAAVCAEIRKNMLSTAMVSNNQLYAAQQIQQCFEEKGIFNLLLKGISTRELYPDPDMRTMNDVDILCKPSQQNQIRKIMEQLGFTNFQEGRLHDCYDRPPFVHVEMHRQMVAARSPFSGYYQSIWKRCVPKTGCKYTCELSVTDGFVYNLVHLAEHLEEGGIGIRFLVDVYIFDCCEEVDRDSLKAELEKIGLYRLYQNVSCLAKLWFAPMKPQLSEEQAALMKRLEEFVLEGRLFGKPGDGNALAVQKEGRIGFFLKSCFPGYKEMCSMYSWLGKWPILLPWAWLRRGVTSVLFRRKNVRSCFNASRSGDKGRGEQLRKLYREIGYER